MKDSTVVLIATLAFLGAGAVMAYAGLRSRQLGSASKTWPTVPGRVLASMIRRTTKGMVRVFVTYIYTVDGQDFTGHVVRFGDVVGLDEANRVIAAFPADSDTKVFYNPNNPAQAVLEPGGKGSLVLIIIGALMLAFALGGFAVFVAIMAQGR